MIKEKKRFYTIFMRTRNMHLMKDVGMIPYILYKEYGYDSTLVCNGDDREYPYLAEEVKGLKLIQIHARNRKFAKFWYIIRNAKKIDILNLYQMGIITSLFCMNLYKMYNPEGICYLKLDCDLKDMKIFENYPIWKKNIIYCFLKQVDLVSAESGIVCRRFQNCYKKKAMYVPNGVYNIQDGELPEKNCEFLTVSRLGEFQKATDVLLKAFINIVDDCNWNLKLVGTMTENCKKILEELYGKRPELKQRIIYLGEIEDKKLLNQVYAKAKVFVMPSRWESFSLACVEALCYGDYLILTKEVAPAEEFTRKGDFGLIIPAEDVEALSKAMLKAAQIKIDHKLIQEYGLSHFHWKKICGTLDRKFKDIWESR